MEKIEETNEKAESDNLSDLCETTAGDIFDINANVKTLQDFSKLVGTPTDNEEIRNKINKLQGTVNKRISLTIRNIKKIKHDTPRQDKMIRLQTEKIEDTFIAAIRRYSGLQKEIRAKEKTHLLINADVECPSEEDVLQDPQRESQVLRDMKYEEEKALEQQQWMKNVQTDIVDINQIMEELGMMVQKDAVAIDKVEKNITKVAENIKDGTKNLEETKRYKMRSKRRIIYLSAIIIILTIILIIILYYQFGERA